MKTVFEDDLDSFFYGTTCVSESPVPLRDAVGIVTNVTKKSIINRISRTAVGLVGTVALAVGLSGNVGTQFNSGQKRHLSGARASNISQVDERTRSDLVYELLEIREIYNLSQDEVADLLNISKSTISKFERGEHAPDLKNYTKYLSFISLIEYLKDNLNDKKYAIRQILHQESKLFGGMNLIGFSKTIGEEGLNEVISLLKRQYG